MTYILSYNKDIKLDTCYEINRLEYSNPLKLIE